MTIQFSKLNSKSVAIFVDGSWFDTVAPGDLWAVYLDLCVGY